MTLGAYVGALGREPRSRRDARPGFEADKRVRRGITRDSLFLAPASLLSSSYWIKLACGISGVQPFVVELGCPWPAERARGPDGREGVTRGGLFAPSPSSWDEARRKTLHNRWVTVHS